MTVKELSNLWDMWIGSKEMLIPKTLNRPVNFLGSIADHKKKFLAVAERYIEEKSKNELKKNQEFDIIRQNQVLINVPCDCESGCKQCGNTKVRIGYVKKIRHK